MKIIGWYYLHANGSLIYKAHVDAAADIRDSDLARCMWPMDPTDRKGAWDICVEGLALGADPARVVELATKWGCDDVDADWYASVVGIRLQLDGSRWFAAGLNFIDLQQSPAGFGDTKLQAMAALAKDMKLSAGKMWRTTFADLLAQKVAA